MIYSSIFNNSNDQGYSKLITDAINFFKDTDFSKYEEGEFEIDGRTIFFQVKDILTKNVEDANPEVHRKYIDVQFLYKGKERIGFAFDNGKNEVLEDMLDSRDLLFYKNVQGESFIDMKEGDFAVFFPSDVHRPACENNGNSPIRKVVYKISYDKYREEINERS